jgi:hypothetical protein
VDLNHGLKFSHYVGSNNPLALTGGNHQPTNAALSRDILRQRFPLTKSEGTERGVFDTLKKSEGLG